jgi:hypothetical protein
VQPPHNSFTQAGDVRDGKAGPNPVVTLYVVDTENNSTVHIPTANELLNQYVTENLLCM